MWAFVVGFFVGDTVRKSGETDAEHQDRTRRRNGWAIVGYLALLLFGLCLLVAAVASAF